MLRNHPLRLPPDRCPERRSFGEVGSTPRSDLRVRMAHLPEAGPAICVGGDSEGEFKRATALYACHMKCIAEVSIARSTTLWFAAITSRSALMIPA